MTVMVDDASRIKLFVRLLPNSEGQGFEEDMDQLIANFLNSSEEHSRLFSRPPEVEPCDDDEDHDDIFEMRVEAGDVDRVLAASPLSGFKYGAIEFVRTLEPAFQQQHHENCQQQHQENGGFVPTDRATVEAARFQVRLGAPQFSEQMLPSEARVAEALRRHGVGEIEAVARDGTAYHVGLREDCPVLRSMATIEIEGLRLQVDMTESQAPPEAIPLVCGGKAGRVEVDVVRGCRPCTGPSDRCGPSLLHMKGTHHVSQCRVAVFATSCLPLHDDDGDAAADDDDDVCWCVVHGAQHPQRF